MINLLYIKYLPLVYVTYILLSVLYEAYEVPWYICILLNVVEGTCQKISRGTVTIEVSAGICKGHSKVGDCMFGWNSWTHVMISETYTETIIQDY